jgi:hypothetical protein
MSIAKKPEVSHEELLLGDYITVSAASLDTSEPNRGEQCHMQSCRDIFVQRARKQRGELFQQAQRQSGKLIDVRCRGAA